MPELPEVETIRRDLDKLIKGKKILKLWTDSPKQVKPSAKKVEKEIVNSTIKKIGRRAKILYLVLANKKIIIIHLKLTGQLLVRKKTIPPDKYQHIVLSLSNNKELRFCDLRKFGWLKLLANQKELDQALKEFGPEPLDDLTFKYFKDLLDSTTRNIKTVLLDQKKISGIGNIYANDALFLAKINPSCPANKIAKDKVKKLYQAIEKVLKAGLRYRGASDQHYLDALGHKGAYQDHFLVYGRTNKKCFKCKGKVKRIKISGRGTFYCPNCQKDC